MEEDEVFSALHKSEATKECMLSENSENDIALQNSMDCGSAGAVDECALAGSRSNAAQTHSSNGHKSKTPNSPSSDSAKVTCAETQSANPKLTLCLSSRKGPSTPSDVEMLSPDSPICKPALFNNSADKDYEGGACADDSGIAKAKLEESELFVGDSDCGGLVKEKAHVVAMGTRDAEIAEYSGSSDISQDLIESQSSVIFERYLRFLLLCATYFFKDAVY